MKKYLLAIPALVTAGLVAVLPVYAQFSTTTVETILDETLADASTILEVNLPTIFVFLIAISGTFMLFRWIRGVIRRPR